MSKRIYGISTAVKRISNNKYNGNNTLRRQSPRLCQIINWLNRGICECFTWGLSKACKRLYNLIIYSFTILKIGA